MKDDSGAASASNSAAVCFKVSTTVPSAAAAESLAFPGGGSAAELSQAALPFVSNTAPWSASDGVAAPLLCGASAGCALPSAKQTQLSTASDDHPRK